MSDGEAFLTTTEVAEQCEVDVRTVVAWIESGRLRALNVATGTKPTYRVHKADAREFVVARGMDPERAARLFP